LAHSTFLLIAGSISAILRDCPSRGRWKGIASAPAVEGDDPLEGMGSQMKVILLKHVENVGLPGEVASVANGYYRNFLLPRRLALEATESNLKSLASKREKLRKDAEKVVEAAEELGARLQSLTLKFVEKVSEKDRLFGSITTTDIARKLESIGYKLQRRNIALPQVIKTVGTFSANVRIHSNVSVPITIVVEKEAGEEEADAAAVEAADRPVGEEAPAEQAGAAAEPAQESAEAKPAEEESAENRPKKEKKTK
jgi:large subunit ribosomal protein L9